MARRLRQATECYKAPHPTPVGVRPTIPAAYIGGKDTYVAKDLERTPAKLLNQIRKEWGFEADEPTAKAQTQALAPLQKWLSTGTKSPDVVIRAVQVLLADPEVPGIDQRHAIDEVSQQVAEIWAKSGQGPQGVLGLQAMVLAAWPYEARQGSFALTPMLDSAWSAMMGRERYRARINEWRRSILEPKTTKPPQSPDAPTAAQQPLIPLAPLKTTAAGVASFIEYLRKNANVGWTYNNFAIQLVGVLDALTSDLANLSQAMGSLPATLTSLTTGFATLRNQINAELARALQSSRVESALLWWGQARYSQSLLTPYRRIKNPDERLWWMAWESSQLALQLDVEPAASFLIETLCQVGDDISEKRPLIAWIRELVSVLRRTEQELDISEKLADMASDDALGLPVTWARLEASDSDHQDTTLEERAGESTGLNLNVEIDRGEWAAWVFREVLLDQHLGAH